MRRRRDRRKPWIIAVCVFMAIGLALPIYDIFSPGGPGGTVNDGGTGDEVVDRLKQQAETMEDYLEEYGPTPAVLRDLADVYRHLSFYSDPEERINYMQKAIVLMEKAVKQAPRDPENYMILHGLYRQLGMNEMARNTAGEGAAVMEELLEENPDDNLTRYYYSILLQDRDKAAAREQLEIILDSEPDDSELSIYARQELAGIDEKEGGD